MSNIGPSACNAIAFFLTGLTLGLAGAAYARRFGDRIALTLGLGLFVADVLFFRRFGLDVSHWRVETSLMWVIPAGLATAVCLLAFSIGLPWWLAKRTGIGMRSPRLEFDRELSVNWAAYTRAIQRATIRPTKKDANLADAVRYLERMERLQPPDESWAALRNSLLTLGERTVGHLHTRGTADSRGLRRMAAEIDARRASLQAAMFVELNISPIEQRRKANRTGLVVLVPAILLGIGFWVVTASRSPGSQPTDPWLWLELSLAAAGLDLIIYAIVAATEALWREIGRSSGERR